MEELEESGMTRNEILYDDPNVGVPLKDDPFFQLIKNSKTVREMLITANEEFSADRVIEKALRQDVGPDPSLSAKKENYKFMNFKDDAESISWEYKKKYRDYTPTIKADSYFGAGNIVEKQNKQLEYEMEKPATFLNRPMTRG